MAWKTLRALRAWWASTAYWAWLMQLEDFASSSSWIARLEDSSFAASTLVALHLLLKSVLIYS
jgi:hypothetical protein